MDFHILSAVEADWHFHSYGVKEPKIDWPLFEPPAFASEKTLMVAPGLAFDKNKGRLGRGKGFYDRYIKRYEKMLTTAAVCFSEQVVENVPVDNHDTPVSCLITENGILFSE